MQNGINSGIVIPFSKILLADEFVENERFIIKCQNLIVILIFPFLNDKITCTLI